MTHDATPFQLPSAYPRTTGEFIAVMSHVHRAEIARMAGWLDRTAGWAIAVVAATLSVALSTPAAHHGVLLFAMAGSSAALFALCARQRARDAKLTPGRAHV